MLTAVRTWLRAEHGASPISLLATVAALVIVAAIAVPSLTKSGAAGTQASQTGAATAQAQDQQAQSLLETGQTAMATYAATSNSGYQGVSPSALNAVEPTLLTASTKEAYLAAASGTATSYTMEAVNPLTGDTFTLTDNSGVASRTCTPAGHGGCTASGTF
jgi:type II secretory pathway pseudopilin PulG